MNASASADELLELGKIVGVHGVGGGLRVRLHDANSEALAVGRSVLLRSTNFADWSATITRVAKTPGDPLVKLWVHELNDRYAAHRWQGSTLWIHRQHLPALAAGEFFLADTIGRSVRLEGRPESLGHVQGVTSNGAQDLLIVHWQSPTGELQEWLLPAMTPFVRDLQPDALIVAVPEGFLPDELESQLGREGALVVQLDPRADRSNADDAGDNTADDAADNVGD